MAEHMKVYEQAKKDNDMPKAAGAMIRYKEDLYILKHI